MCFMRTIRAPNCYHHARKELPTATPYYAIKETVPATYTDFVICLMCTTRAPQCSLCATEPSTITHDAVRATTLRAFSVICTLPCARSVLSTPQEVVKTLSATTTPPAPRTQTMLSTFRCKSTNCYLVQDTTLCAQKELPIVIHLDLVREPTSKAIIMCFMRTIRAPNCYHHARKERPTVTLSYAI